MFKYFLSKIPGFKLQTNKSASTNPGTAALMKVIEKQRKTDPLIGAKIGSKEINRRLFDAMKTEKGVHIESILCALSALAGYACQASLRVQALEKGMSEVTALVVIDTANGKKYFFGDPLNQLLVESKYSVWSLAAGAAQHNGCSQLPDINDIFRHVTTTVGNDNFGIPRLPDKHQPSDTPVNYLKALWPHLLPVIKQFCPTPSEWPILYGLAIQEVIDMAKGIITPDLALTIVMESAIPMSKIDLASA